MDQMPANSQLLFFRNYFYWCKGGYVKPEVDLFRKLCNPKKVSVDIGANEGLYAMYLCRFSSQLHCFEPLPWLAEQLQKKFSGVRNVHIENCALGSRDETANIRIPTTKTMQYDTRSSLVSRFDEQWIEGNSVLSVKELPVTVKRLDDFNLGDVGFMKIDVEGFELEVLKGGVQTIVNNWPNLYVEIEQKHHQDVPIATIFDFILNLGYKGFFQFRQQLLPLQKFVPEQHQAMVKCATKEDYCGDFIFLPKNGPALQPLGLG